MTKAAGRAPKKLPGQAPGAEQKASARQVLRDLGALTVQTYQLSRGLGPLLKLLRHDQDVHREQLTAAMDRLFDGLYAHPVTRSTEKVTGYLRARKLIPNEQSTEELIRFVVEQLVQRSPVPVPDALVQEFWLFFEELFSSPELKGLGELSLDMVRLVVRTYEPLLVEVINLLKAGRRFNQWQMQELTRRVQIVRDDIVIIRRQIRALRYIKPFFQADPRDFAGQAQIVAQMVREFGPFFVKMAQVAAANADFLPEEIARELAVFHEDVPPMSAEEVNQAFMECHGQLPTQMYWGFDAEAPVRSGSIGSVYVAKKPFMEDGEEVLRSVVIKVGRHNIDREFAIGKLVLGLAIMSSQYWAPHSKLAPFLRAMQEQVDEFVAGFTQELDFEAEASNHRRFFERSFDSRYWKVPELYGSSNRILEMEYLADADSLNRALQRLPARRRRRFQRQVAERLLYAVLYQVFVYQEMHGDLHPGNVMVGSDGALYLIDWGNCVSLDGKWQAIWDYLSGAVIADPDLLADALIRVSTDPEGQAQRRAEIRELLAETLQKKSVSTLGAGNFVGELRRGGFSGLHRRGQAVLQLMSNTQQLGLVMHRDYVHLSRALMATVGSFSSLYDASPKRQLALDLISGAARLPLRFSQDMASVEFNHWRERMVRLLPLPKSLRSRLLPPTRRKVAAVERAA